MSQRHLVVLHGGSQNDLIFAGREGKRNKWNDFTSQGMNTSTWYSNRGNANRAIRRLKANGYSHRAFSTVQFFD